MISYVIEWRSKPQNRFEGEDASWDKCIRYNRSYKSYRAVEKDLRKARKEHGQTTEYRLLRVVSKVIG